jgi:hypothetical protein
MVSLNSRPDLSWRCLWCFFLLIMFSMCSPLIHAFILRYMFHILSWEMHQSRERWLIFSCCSCGRTSPIAIVHIAAVGTSSTLSTSTCSLGEPIVSSNTTSLETSTNPDDLLKTYMPLYLNHNLVKTLLLLWEKISNVYLSLPRCNICSQIHQSMKHWVCYQLGVHKMSS